jgi:hypothetical protein
MSMRVAVSAALPTSLVRVWPMPCPLSLASPVAMPRRVAVPAALSSVPVRVWPMPRPPVQPSERQLVSRSSRSTAPCVSIRSAAAS